jgi:hypothetical protein
VPPTDSQPVPLFALWLPAVEAGVVPLEKLVAWADGQIARLPQPPPWLIELSLARNLEGVRRAERAAGERAEAPDAGQLYLGFLYLAHESGRLPMAKLLLEAGRFADGRGHESAIPECEAFYLLLNEIDGGGPTLPEEGPLDDRVSELFAPMAAKARRALADLPPEWRS